MDLPAVSFAHLTHMMGPHGLFEHADGTTPRVEHGYCTDDNARLLVVTVRHGDHGDADELSRRALDFVVSAIAPDGRCHNRMDRSGVWIDSPSAEDCWGRAVWALGTAAAGHTDPAVRASARRGFDLATCQVARWPRSLAFAALGAVEVARVDPTHREASAILRRTLSAIGAVPSGDWRWPEPRLAYANAALAEALIAAGSHLNSMWDVERGLLMLGWLLARETRDGHLSPTPAGGAAPGDPRPGFDQQPIEVAALADACTRAHQLTDDVVFADAVAAAARWFLGDNDARLPMYDPLSGGSYDGLHRDAVNLNQGAESTLALVSTMQRAHQLVGAR